MFQDSGISLWHQQGAPLEKLLLGTPFYGRSFTLTSVNQNKPGAASVGPGAPGKYTNEEGFLSYFEICSKIRSEQGWTTKRDSDGNVYAVRGDQWVGFDTDNAVKRKVHMRLRSTQFQMFAHGERLLDFRCNM